MASLTAFTFKNNPEAVWEMVIDKGIRLMDNKIFIRNKQRRYKKISNCYYLTIDKDSELGRYIGDSKDVKLSYKQDKTADVWYIHIKDILPENHPQYNLVCGHVSLFYFALILRDVIHSVYEDLDVGVI